jgi:hypothetical protein
LRLAADRAGSERARGLFDLVVHDVGSLHGVKGFKSLSANRFRGRRRIRPVRPFYCAWGCFRDFVGPACRLTPRWN